VSELFSPLTLRALTLRNRIGVAPMCQYSSTEGYANDWHFVHLGAAHAAANVAGLLLIVLLYLRAFPLRAWLALLLLAIATIDLGLWWCTSIEWYVGASGVLHAAMTAGIVHDLWQRVRYAKWLATLGVAKLVYERVVGVLPWPNELLADGARVVIEAHWFGVLAGAAFATLWHHRARFRASP
jgi:rhomboid family GlyGly-CTERM serine protease